MSAPGTTPDPASSLERPACPLCGAGESSPVLRAGEDWIPDGVARGLTFEVRRCRACAGCYTTPRFREQDRHLAFAGAYGFYARARRREAGLDPAALGAFAARAALVERAHPRPGRLLDVGMGDGAFPLLMQRRGWQVAGVDVEPSVVAFARERLGLADCAVADAERDALPPGPFDAVTAWGLFQLAYRPRALLEKLRALLAPGGVLAVGVSNLAGAGARLFGPRWRGLGLPRHLVHYEPATLRRVAEEAGLEVLGLAFETPYWIVAHSVDPQGRWPRPLAGAARRAAYAALRPLGSTRRGDTMVLLARARP